MRYLLALLLAALLIAGMVALAAAVPLPPELPSAASQRQAPPGSQLLLVSLAHTIRQHGPAIAAGLLVLCLATAALCPPRAAKPRTHGPSTQGKEQP